MVLTKRLKKKKNNIMDFADMKIYALNSMAFLVTMTEIETWLKIILLLCTIVYTVMKTKKL